MPMSSSEPKPPGSVLEVALYADDLVAAELFYRTVLRLTPFQVKTGRHVFFRLDKQVLLIFNPAATRVPPGPGALPVPPHGGSGQGHVCFPVAHDEIAGWRRHLERMGVAIEAEFEWPAGGRSLYFRDPAGNSIEFAEPRIWGL